MTKGREDAVRKDRAAAEHEHQDLLEDAYQADQERCPAFRDFHKGGKARSRSPEYKLERPDVHHLLDRQDESRLDTPSMYTVSSLEGLMQRSSPQVPSRGAKES